MFALPRSPLSSGRTAVRPCAARARGARAPWALPRP